MPGWRDWTGYTLYEAGEPEDEARRKEGHERRGPGWQNGNPKASALVALALIADWGDLRPTHFGRSLGDHTHRNG